MSTDTDNNIPDWFLLDAYFADSCTQAQRAALEQWIAASAGNPEVVADLKAAWELRRDRKPRDWQRAQAISEVMSRVERQSNGSSVARIRSRSVSRFVAVALVAVVAVSGLGYWRASKPLVSNNKPTAYVTANSQQATVELSDGSVVRLSVASRLEVPKNFGRAERKVRLHGAALFSVVQSVNAPFIVETGNTQTTVLGTEFSVRKYSADDHVSVAVKSGKVSVTTTTTSVTLSKDKKAAIDNHGIAIIDTVKDSDFAFVSGRLVFDNTPLSVAVPEIERWYNVKLALADASLGAQTLVGGVTGASPSDLAHALEVLFEARAIVHGRNITLYKTVTR